MPLFEGRTSAPSSPFSSSRYSPTAGAPFYDSFTSGPRSPSPRIGRFVEELEREIIRDTIEKERKVEKKQSALLDREVLLDMRERELASRDKLVKLKESHMQENLDKEMDKVRTKQIKLEVEIEATKDEKKTLRHIQLECQDLRAQLERRERELKKKNEDQITMENDHRKKTSELQHQLNELNAKKHEIGQRENSTKADTLKLSVRERDLAWREENLRTNEFKLSLRQSELERKEREVAEAELVQVESRKRINDKIGKLNEKKAQFKVHKDEIDRTINKNRASLQFVRDVRDVLDDEWMSDPTRIWKIRSLTSSLYY